MPTGLLVLLEYQSQRDPCHPLKLVAYLKYSKDELRVHINGGEGQLSSWSPIYVPCLGGPSTNCTSMAGGTDRITVSPRSTHDTVCMIISLTSQGVGGRGFPHRYMNWHWQTRRIDQTSEVMRY